MAVSKQVRAALLALLEPEPWFTHELSKELPLKWEKHGDLVLVSEATFSSTNIWLEHSEILREACKLLRCNRLARRVGPTQSDDFRSPKVELVWGNSTLVTKKENGILYSWDLSKCMFSSGNISEKQRLAKLDLRGKTVVDMYAGIGYFTLTFLVHSRANLVYACEWNPAAEEALKNNLNLNKIAGERCIVLAGDNKLMCPKNVADHVNLGLIPSSEHGWATACAALKVNTGGVLHVHGNVDTKQKMEESCGRNYTSENSIRFQFEWARRVCSKIEEIFSSLYRQNKWNISISSATKVKSYAPFVDHVVADILCEPDVLQKE